MKMVAYVDTDGKGFGDMPWLESVPDDIAPKEFMLQLKTKYQCQRVVLFECVSYVDPFHMTWEDIEQGKIAEA